MGYRMHASFNLAARPFVSSSKMRQYHSRVGCESVTYNSIKSRTGVSYLPAGDPGHAPSYDVSYMLLDPDTRVLCHVTPLPSHKQRARSTSASPTPTTQREHQRGGAVVASVNNHQLGAVPDLPLTDQDVREVLLILFFVLLLELETLILLSLLVLESPCKQHVSNLRINTNHG